MNLRLVEISDSTVAVTVQDKAGNTQTYRYTGDVSWHLTAHKSGAANVGIAVTPTPKRESSEHNAPSDRYKK